MVKDDDYLEPRRRSPLRWLVRLVFLLAFVVVLAAAAPWIVAKTALRQQIVPYLLPEFAGTCDIGDAQLGWLSNVELGNVQLTDADGQRLAAIEKIACDKTLLDLVSGNAGVMTVQLDRPDVDLVVRHDGSNWEDALQTILEREQSDGEPMSVSVKAVEGTVRVHDAERQLSGVLGALNLDCQYRPSEEVPVQLTSSANVHRDADAESNGTLTATLELGAAATTETSLGSSGKVAVQAEQALVDALTPLLNRFVPQLALRGHVSSDVTVGWHPGVASGKTTVTGSIQSEDLAVLPEQWTSDEWISLFRFAADLQIAIEGDRLFIERCNIDSEPARLDAKGSLNIDQLSHSAVSSIFSQEDYQINGRIDLASLAKQLPGLLRIREGARLTTGEVVFELQSSLVEGTRQWSADVSTKNLRAMASGRPIEWSAPAEVRFAAAERPGGKIAGQLRCSSEYLTIDVDGTTDNATIAIQSDLTRLANDLRPLIDLDDLQLAGNIQSAFDIRYDEQGGFDANGHAQFQRFQFTAPGARPLSEQRMTVAVEAAGFSKDLGLTRLDRAAVRMVSAGDKLSVTLLQPVDRPSADSQWPVDVRLLGRLATWMPRLQAWLPMQGWLIEGDIDLAAQLAAGKSAVVVENAEAQINRFRAIGAGRSISEPTIKVTTSGSWDLVKGEIVSKLTTANTQTDGLRAEDLHVVIAGGEPEASAAGNVTFRGELQQIQSWLSSARGRPSQLFRGQVDARLQMASRGGNTTCDWNVLVNNLQVLQPATSGQGVAATDPMAPLPARPVARTENWQPVWTEQQLSMTGRGAYRAAGQHLALDAVSLKSKALQIGNTSGQITNVADAPLADISGEWQYDLQVLTALLRPYIGDQVQLIGSGKRPFRFRGRLPIEQEKAGETHVAWWSQTSGEASAGWDTIDAYGLVGGAGELHATLDNGVVTFKPIDIPFNDGRLRNTPKLRLDRGTPLLVLSPGQAIERAKLTETLCQSWLQYVAPALSQSTRVEGRFSLALERSVTPISTPEQSDVAGTLTIHAAQVRPGPLTAQLASIASQVDAIIKRQPGQALGGGANTVLRIAEQDVRFQFTEGRVHHQNFQVEVGDVMVRTSGSVGIDNSLALVAEIPIRDKWIQRDRFLTGLRGQTLKIPIRGTLGQPKLDRTAITQLGRQMLGGAAEGFLEDALNKGLQKGLNGLFK